MPALLLWALLPWFQDGYRDNAAIKVDYTQTVMLVTTPVRVVADDEFVRRLKPEDFRVLENGKPATVVTVTQQKRPLRIHMLFDLSASNAYNLIAGKIAARDVVGAMKSGDFARITYFSVTYGSLSSYSNDKKDLRKRIDLMSPLGTTALYDGIAGALRDLSAFDGNRVLVVFCDGYDLASKIQEQELLALVKKIDLPIYLVTFNTVSQETPMMARQTNFLKNLVKISNGLYIKGENIRALTRKLADLRRWYSVSFSPNSPEDSEGERQVHITAPGCESCRVDFQASYHLKQTGH